MIPVGCVAGKHPENKGWMLAAQPLHATEMRKSHEQGKPPDRLEAWQPKGMGKEASPKCGMSPVPCRGRISVRAFRAALLRTNMKARLLTARLRMLWPNMPCRRGTCFTFLRAGFTVSGIFDFNRLGLDGKPRELHTALARDAMDFTVQPDYRTHYRSEKNAETVLVECPHFRTSLFDMDRSVTKDIAVLDSFLVVMCTEGEGTVADSRGNTVYIRSGETVLMPACSGHAVFTPQQQMKLLTSCV